MDKGGDWTFVFYNKERKQAWAELYKAQVELRLAYIEILFHLTEN